MLIRNDLRRKLVNLLPHNLDVRLSLIHEPNLGVLHLIIAQRINAAVKHCCSTRRKTRVFPLDYPSAKTNDNVSPSYNPKSKIQNPEPRNIEQNIHEHCIEKHRKSTALKLDLVLDVLRQVGAQVREMEFALHARTHPRGVLPTLAAPQSMSALVTSHRDSVSSYLVRFDPRGSGAVLLD